MPGATASVWPPSATDCCLSGEVQVSLLILDRRNLQLDYVTDCLLIRSPTEPPRTVPLSRLSKVLCMHNVRVSTQLISHMLARGVDFVVINLRHSELGFSVHADHQQDAARRSAQYRWQWEDAERLALSKRMLALKLGTMARVLGRFRAEDTTTLRESLAHSLRQCRRACEEDVLRGIEGAAQRQMFSFWRQLLPARLGFQGRRRRPPPDPVNAVLSLTYVLVHEEAVRQLKVAGLDPQLGFYHRLAHGRRSLACDLIEPLRPRIEAAVVAMFVHGELDLRHFGGGEQGCRLGKAGREFFYGRFSMLQLRWRTRLSAYARLLARVVEAGSPTPDQASGHE